MKKKSLCLITLAIISVMCAFMSGCAPFRYGQVVYNERTKSIPLRSPANFTVKVIGKTTYNNNGNIIPVGDILRQSLEANLKQIENFSSDTNSDNQYIIGLDIVVYDPKFATADEVKNVIKDKLKTTAKDTVGKFTGINLWSDEEDSNVGNIVCDVSLYTVKTDLKGEKIIGDKLLLFTEAFVAGESLDKYNIMDVGQVVMQTVPINVKAASEIAFAAKAAVDTVDSVASLNAAETMIKGCGIKISKVLEKEFKKNNK